MQFGIPGYDDLVWDVSLVCDRIGSSTQHGLNSKLQLSDCLIARARIKINRYRHEYASKNIAFAPAMLSVADKIHPEFLCLLWVLADMQTVKYFNLVGDDEDIRNERCKRNWARTFSYNRNVIGLAVAYASAIRTHLSVHGTAHPMSAASVHPRSAADSLIRNAVDISHPSQQENPPASSSAASGFVRSDIINGLGAGTVGVGGNPSLFSSLTIGVVPSFVNFACAPPPSGRGNYLATQSQASYHSLEAILYVATLSMALVTVHVQSGGLAFLPCPLAGLLALFPGLLSLFLSLCHRVTVSTFQHKVKHCILVPFRVSWLAVPHLALMLSTRRPMHARVSSLQTGMPMYARALQ